MEMQPRTEKYLFRWIGSDIEKLTGRKRVRLNQSQREKYLMYLDAALDEQKGLFAKVPGGEYLGKVISESKSQKQWEFESSLPCLCFTELDLGDSAHHISRFGRMGFGFTKQFIIEQGGGPVQYCLGTKDCDRVTELAKIRRFLKDQQDKGALKPDIWDAFLHLAHFYKRTREVVESRKSPRIKLRGEVVKAIKPNRPKPLQEDDLADQARYGCQREMPHLEEYEWRLVFRNNHKKWHLMKGDNRPEAAWFHIKAGHELQMVIVPDNRCYQIVHQDSKFTDRLFRIPQKPVQVISLEILGRVY